MATYSSDRRPKFASPLAARLTQQVQRISGGDEAILSADLGLTSYRPEASTAADSISMRRLRRAQMRAETLGVSVDLHRRKRYIDFREMALEVPELGTSLDVMCNFVFSGDSGHGATSQSGPRIIFAEGAPAAVRDAVESATRDLDINKLLLEIFREGMKLGDSFTELVYTKDGTLVDQKPLRADYTDVVWDEFGRTSSYKVSTSQGYLSSVGLGGVILAPWQVLHFAPDRPRGHKYGVSNWSSARKIWRISQASLDVLAILAILRASARKSVSLPVPAGIKEDEVLAFVEQLKAGAWRDEFFDKDGTLRHRIASMLELDDIVYPYRQGTERPTFHNEPSADLTQLVDLQKYLQESYFVATGVPAALCGLERNVNARSTLEQQGLHFVRTVRRRQEEVSRLAEDILIRACLGKGIRPSQGDFVYSMPVVSTFDLKLRAEVSRIRAEAAKILSVDMGVDLRWVLSRVVGVEGADLDGIMESSAASSMESLTASTATPGLLRETHELASMAEDLKAIIGDFSHTPLEE